MRQYTFVIGTPNPYETATISITVVADDVSAGRGKAADKLWARFGGSHALATRIVNQTPVISGPLVEYIEIR